MTQDILRVKLLMCSGPEQPPGAEGEDRVRAGQHHPRSQEHVQGQAEHQGQARQAHLPEAGPLEVS